MRRVLIAVASVLVSCGSDPGAPGGVGCDFDAVDGTFLVQYDKVSGTCADLQDVVVTTLVGEDYGCTIAKDEPSENGCRHDVDETCPVAGGSIRIVGYLRQRDESGSHFDGLITYYVTTTGGQTCNGTYDITYTKQ